MNLYIINTYSESIKIIINSLAVIAAISWKDIISDGIESIFPLKRDKIASKIIFAILMTYIAVVCTLKYQEYKKPDILQEKDKSK